ncbi:diadenylate cyclase CdaA [Treponema primitia]|uniref:diadenylate cyclase CdaA n=1 Tax=Treponema primitia TaxID=88058 RepID=UPI00025558ED|nr:diadenylate cyclase CdaA [Treponema primitia]
MEWFQRLTSIYDIIRPVVDIAILAFLLYKAYDLLVKTQAVQLVKGAGFLALFYGIAYLFKLTTLQWLLTILAPGLFIAIAIVFQPELRKIFIRLGQGELFRPDSKPRIGQLEAVITAAEILSQERRGALVVFPRRINIKSIIETGTRINGEISSSLIVAIFEFDGPLHDGAMIIQNGRITAAGCFLPLSEQQDIRKSFGTRHRASLGMSEQSDAVILVVSEETGAISLAVDGKLYYDLSPIEVQRKLKELLDRGVRGGDSEQKTGSVEVALDSALDDGKDVFVER